MFALSSNELSNIITAMYNTLITVNELLPNYVHENWVIVDCRFQLGDVEAGRNAYETAHIPGAVYAHLDEDLSGIILPGMTGRHPLPDVEELTALFSSWGITDGVQVVAYDDKSGAIAARLWWMLKWLGHESVAVLDSGWSGWLKAGGTQTSGVEDKQAAKFTARPDKSRIKPLAAIEAAARNFTLVDSRTAERYRGEKEPIDPVAGHIPGAINFPHPNNVSPDGTWKDKAALRAQFEALLQNQDKAEVVFYCGSGVTACRNILAYEAAGLGTALLYPGSWSEWIVDEERAIEKEGEN